MKSFRIGGRTTIFHEDNTWEHPTEEVVEYLNQETEHLIKNHSPADGSLREYVFSRIIEGTNVTEVTDTDKEAYEDESENTIY